VLFARTVKVYSRRCGRDFIQWTSTGAPSAIVAPGPSATRSQNLIRTLDVPLAQARGSSVVALKANMHRMMKSFFVATALVAAASSAQAQLYNWNSPLNGGP